MIKLEKIGNRYETGGTVSAGSPSDWIRLVEWPRSVLIACMPSGGTMRMEYTLDSEDAVKAGTARAIAWEDGDVSGNTTTSIPSTVTAVRFVGDGDYRVVI